MKVLNLKYRFPFRNSIWMVFLLILSVMLAGGEGRSTAQRIIIFSVPVTFAIFRHAQYQLVVEGEYCFWRVNFIFYKHLEKVFLITEIKEIKIEQEPNKYYFINLLLEDSEIYLISFPTLDVAKKTEVQINNVIYES